VSRAIVSDTDGPPDQRLDLVGRRHRVGAGEARRHDRAGGAREREHAPQVPAREEPVHERAAEGVARAETIHHLDPDRRYLHALRLRPRERAAQPLLHDRELGPHREEGLGRGVHVARASRHLDFVDVADDDLRVFEDRGRRLARRERR
jgi:hypothetical protein